MDIESRISEALELLEMGEKSKALELLEVMLKEFPANDEVRLLLSQIYGVDGEKEKHLEILKGGLKTEKELDSDEKKEFQIMYLTNLGKYYFASGGGTCSHDHHGEPCNHDHHHHHHGETCGHDHGESCNHEYGEIDDETKKKNNELALGYFNKVSFLVSQLDPDDQLQEVKMDIARTLERLGRHEEALKIWELFVELTGEDEFLLSKVKCMGNVFPTEELLTRLEAMIVTNPRSTILYQKLEEVFLEKKDEKKAKEASSKKFFFSQVPKFCRTLSLNEKNMNIFQTLYMKKKEEEEDDEEVAKEILRKLSVDKSMESTELLLCVCFNHQHCGEVESLAYAALEKRLSDPEVNKLVFEMIKGNDCSCTIKKTVEILTNVKDPKILETLVKLLPTDTQNFNWNFGIPECMAKLEDSRCIQPLMDRVSDISGEKEEEEGEGEEEDDDDDNNEGQGSDLLKDRCLLALISYVKGNEKVRDFLKKGLKNEKYMVFCAVGLVYYYQCGGDQTTPKDVLKCLRDGLQMSENKDYHCGFVLEILEGIKSPGSKEVVMELIQEIQKVQKEDEEEKEKQEKLQEELSLKYEKEGAFSELIAQKCCTFQVTGKCFIVQKVFHCTTCGLMGDVGLCEACVQACHSGHEVFESEESPSKFFCDCGLRGEEKCKGMDNKYVEKQN